MQTNRNRTNNSSKGNNSTITQEPAQPRSYLADLFKPAADADAEAERNANFGYPPLNTHNSASFTK